jgi:O-antigen/teichoic acid export membrane protein
MISYADSGENYKLSIHKWTSKFALTILDQGLFSGSNFLVSLLLARYVAPSLYGIFSVSYSIFLFIAGLYSSLILEPINVLGPKYHDNELMRYKSHVIQLHIHTTIVFFIIGVIGVFVLPHVGYQSEYLQELTWIFLSIPFVMFFWLARQCSYLETKPQVAVVGSLIYSILYLGGFILMALLGNIGISFIFISMSIAGFIGGVVIFILLGISSSTEEFLKSGFSSGLIKENWNYGKWILFASIAYGISTLIYSPLIGVTLGSVQAGVFRSMQNLFLPFTQIVTASILLITPNLSRIAIKGNTQEYKRRTLFYVGILLCSSLLYFVVVQLSGSVIVDFIYNKVEYDQSIWIIPFLGIATIISTLNSVLGMIFRIKESTATIFWAKVISAIAVVVVCIPLVNSLQMRGVLLGLNISLIVETAVLLIFGILNRNKNAQQN